jgi:hypothetical protein
VFSHYPFPDLDGCSDQLGERDNVDIQPTPDPGEHSAMSTIDIFYQGEGIQEVDHIEVDAEQTFAAIKAMLITKHGLSEDILIFLENGEEPIDDEEYAIKHGESGRIKAHIHRCRHVNVSVTFNNETVEHRFGPGTTVAHVKHWAAERKFSMTHGEATEHVLQISGTHDRPPPGTHLGALAKCIHCQVAFDLVPDQRINGSYGGVV